MNIAFKAGVFPFADAARLTGLKSSRVREWFVGRVSEPNRKPVFRSTYEPMEHVSAIGFLDLVEVYVAGHLRNFGVSLPTLRKVYSKLGKEFSTRHPFARNELLTDGKAVFVHGLDKSGETEIYDALTKQRAFPQLLSFFQRIDYDAVSALATRWRIAKGVVIDPTMSFGKPVLLESRIPTYLIAAEYHANNRNAERVAGWYAISSEEVLDAVKFESGLAA